MPRMYVRHSTMYEKKQQLHFISQNWRKETSTVANGFSPIKIHYSGYPKPVNEVYVISIKYRYSDIL